MTLIPEALPAPDADLPDEPLVVIEERNAWISIDVAELWRNRELLYFLTWRDIKVRYKQTVLGAAWALLQPAFMMLIFTLVFSRLAGEVEHVPYPLFALAGLVPWTFFSNAVTNSGNSLVNNVQLVTKVYFPRLIMPAAAVFAGLVDLGFSALLLGALMLYYGVHITGHILMLPVLFALTTLCALSTGMWMSALNVKYRDVRFALPFIVQVWLFASSVVVPSTVVPERFRWLLTLNPMSAVIEGCRAALFTTPFHWRAIGIAAVLTIAGFVVAAHFFKQTERGFADFI
ncbi:MAG TPA: ABC transporter permease [Thermoanaerobaculia bacterium]|jgi:lipopolysaccharide transport system permease protein|nr:ABC transporter permease [Thermoanaerobaculia bacterium]